MSVVGHTYHDRRNRRQATVTAADEVEGRSFTLEYRQAPLDRGHRLEPHWHESWVETFEVLSGQARYRVGRKEAELHEGQTVVMPPGQVHVHPWNGGTGELNVRQTVQLLRPDPAAVVDTLEAFAMLFWLRNRSGDDAVARVPLLQTALIMRRLQRHGGYPAGLPAGVQRAAVGILSPIAERMGYVEHDPRAMAR